MVQPRLPDLSLFRKSIAIERRPSPTRIDFENQYLAGSGRPVILTDSMSSWLAIGKWSFDFFAGRYGDDDVMVSDDLRHPTKTLRMKFRTFLNFCNSFETPGLEQFPRPPLYLGLQPFLRHPELLGDFSQPSVANCIYEGREREVYQWYVDYFGVILIGSSGTVTTLHVDLFGTHNWLAQMCGRKHWLLFSPKDAKNLDYGNVNLLQPDPAKLPNLQSAQPYEAVLHPGETIFVPQGWYHHVVSLSPSISLSFNFVNQTNIVRHILAISRESPQWSKRIKSLEARLGSRLF